MTSYSVFVHAHVAELVSSLKPRERTQLLKFFNKLRSNPFLTGDYTEHDLIGRPIEVVILGRFAIVFWADHAVSEIKILDVRPAGS